MKKPNESVVVKSVSGIVVLLVVFSAIVSVIGYKGFTDALLEQYSDGTLLIADSAALSVKADEMDNYKNSGGTTAEYKDVWESLDSLCNSSGSTFIYVIQPDLTDYAHITFLFSTINKDSPYTVYDFGYVRETTNDEYKQKYRALYDGTSSHEIVIRDKGYIETDTKENPIIRRSIHENRKNGKKARKRQGSFQSDKHDMYYSHNNNIVRCDNVSITEK